MKRERVLHAPDDALDFTPSWYGERALQLGKERGAIISLSGPAAPHLFDDLDPDRVGRDRYPSVPEYLTVINDKTVNWCIAPCPTPAWAELVYPDTEPDEALAKLWEDVIHICRLDEDDPIAAWTVRIAELVGAADRMTEQHFDAVQFEGRAQISRSGSCRALGGRAAAARPSKASSTCRTCRRRRFSPAPIPSASKASSGRPSPSSRRGRSSTG